MSIGSKSHGNLMYYKIYTRPAVRRMYGYTEKMHTKHQENVHNVLKMLFLNGLGTTWDMARVRISNINKIREQEKIFRRLLKGRTDRGRHSNGIIDTGLVIKEHRRRGPYARYRLSLYGILYCIDVMNPTNTEFDIMASKYADILPRVFGRWDKLKAEMGQDVYCMKFLAKGLYMNNPSMTRAKNPIYELMSYVHIKYKRNFESIVEYALADQISYWYYTFPLYSRGMKGFKDVLKGDKDTRDWYMEFFKQADKYYKARMNTMEYASEILK